MMNARQIGLSFVLADFTALTAYAVHQHGVVGLFEALTANLATTTAFVDLVIALSLVMVWMWRDARDRGVSALPYVVLTLVAGSVGPLVYLIRREGRAQRRVLAATAVAR
jgi:hypothetical protein